MKIVSRILTMEEGKNNFVGVKISTWTGKTIRPTHENSKPRETILNRKQQLSAQKISELLLLHHQSIVGFDECAQRARLFAFGFVFLRLRCV